jgi:membrane protein DedA with SNARE-associated domain
MATVREFVGAYWRKLLFVIVIFAVASAITNYDDPGRTWSFLPILVAVVLAAAVAEFWWKRRKQRA